MPPVCRQDAPARNARRRSCSGARRSTGSWASGRPSRASARSAAASTGTLRQPPATATVDSDCERPAAGRCSHGRGSRGRTRFERLCLGQVEQLADAAVDPRAVVVGGQRALAVRPRARVPARERQARRAAAFLAARGAHQLVACGAVPIGRVVLASVLPGTKANEGARARGREGERARGREGESTTTRVRGDCDAPTGRRLLSTQALSFSLSPSNSPSPSYAPSPLPLLSLSSPLPLLSRPRSQSEHSPSPSPAPCPALPPLSLSRSRAHACVCVSLTRLPIMMNWSKLLPLVCGLPGPSCSSIPTLPAVSMASTRSSAGRSSNGNHRGKRRNRTARPRRSVLRSRRRAPARPSPAIGVAIPRPPEFTRRRQSAFPATSRASVEIVSVSRFRVRKC